MPSARDLAADLLLHLERHGGRVREGLESARARTADPRERGLLTELAYGTVRRQGTLDVVLAAFSRRALAALDPTARVGLRLALYQALFLDRVPPSAAVDHAVGWTRGRAGAATSGYVNGVLRSTLRAIAGPAQGPEDARRDVPREDGSAVRFRDPVFPEPTLAPAANLGARHAMPEWLTARWLERWGPARTTAVLRTQSGRPPVALRVRSGAAAALRRELLAGAPDARVGPVDGSLLLPGGEGGGIAFVERGAVTVQDATAQRVAPLLFPRPGQRLLDLCAAPGGKALHLADLLGSRGEVVACDVEPRKLALLIELRGRVPPGVAWTSTLVPAEGPLPFEPASFDGILVDAPCSNTGVLRRRVEARWRLAVQDLATLATLQRSLLERALPLLKPGGRLVYSTCSLESEENEDVISSFAAAHPDLTRTEGFEVLPNRDADGGFAAVFTTAKAHSGS
jgi:16S rRNA (cytosine967-C5)-methyltransferase